MTILTKLRLMSFQSYYQKNDSIMCLHTKQQRHEHCTKLKQEIKRKTESKIKYGKFYNDKTDIKIRCVTR